MSIRRTRHILTALGIAATTGAVGVAAWGLCWPCQVPAAQPRDRRDSPDDQRDAAATAETLSLDELAKVWDQPLRRPLVDFAPGTAATKAAGSTPGAPAASALNLNLVGTIIESGHSRAVFAMPNGAIELKGVGEIIGPSPTGPEVVAIEPKHVVVRFQGQLTTVRLKGADDS
jgi:hypothetical protein